MLDVVVRKGKADTISIEGEAFDIIAELGAVCVTVLEACVEKIPATREQIFEAFGESIKDAGRKGVKHETGHSS